MLNGLDLFSGIGGLSIALSPWVRPIAYCENDRYAQSVLLSRQADGSLTPAPIWDDVSNFPASNLIGAVDIIYAGFPCQDISVAGNGAGLEGKRSGLFFEILRLADEIKPRFIFLENVPAIRTRGAERIGKELSRRGYDCRWDIISAADVGARHLRKRWFLLAHGHGHGHGREILAESHSQESQSKRTLGHDTDGLRYVIPDPKCNVVRIECGRGFGKNWLGQTLAGGDGQSRGVAGIPDRGPWAIEPDVGRVADGVPARVDRLRGLGNAVVPLQAREAFKRLMGLERIRKEVA